MMTTEYDCYEHNPPRNHWRVLMSDGDVFDVVSQLNDSTMRGWILSISMTRGNKDAAIVGMTLLPGPCDGPEFAPSSLFGGGAE